MDDDYAEAVLDLAQSVPPGRATTYGVLAEVLRERLGRGGPRMVGQAMARSGGAVPWWRVVNAAGEPPAALRAEALARLRAEGCPLTPGGAQARVVLRRAIWWPDDEPSPAGDDAAADASGGAGERRVSARRADASS